MAADKMELRARAPAFGAGARKQLATNTWAPLWTHLLLYSTLSASARQELCHKVTRIRQTLY
jgi:hypothetical protein